MNYKGFLFFILLITFSTVNAQDLKQNSFEQQKAVPLYKANVKRERLSFLDNPDSFPAPSPQNPAYVRPDAKTRVKRYVDAAFGVSALLNAGAAAAVNQITNSPKEWHGTTKGFAKRLGSGYAQGAIGRTVTYGINEAFKLDNHFERSNQTIFSKRLKHVLVSSFATRTATGKYIPDFPQFIGTYTGNIIAKEWWYPKRYTYKDGLKSGTYALLTRFGIHLVREFIHK